MTTTTQLELDLAPVVAVERDRTLPLSVQYRQFAEANPHVLDAFEATTAQWLAHHDRVGMKRVAEKLRWETGVRGDTEWKIDNSMVAFIARDLIARRPEWADRIETRRQRAV